jgi:hypothetical protein
MILTDSSILGLLSQMEAYSPLEITKWAEKEQL